MADLDTTNTSAVQNEEEEEEEIQFIEYPSGKQAAITRVKNIILKYQKNSEIDIGHLSQLFEQLKAKIKVFEEAIERENCKDVSDEAKTEFAVWCKSNNAKNRKFVKDLEKIILENSACANKESSEEDGNEVLSNVGSPSCSSRRLGVGRPEEDVIPPFNAAHSTRSHRTRTSGNFEDFLSDCGSEHGSSSSVGTSATTISDELKNLFLAVQLPKSEPETFSGEDLTLYQDFMLTFQTQIENKCTTFQDKYFYLQKYTCGDAKMLVRSCHQADYKKAFESAKQLLQKQYGNEYRIADQYLEKLQNWSPIKPEDAKGLQKYATFLTNCNYMMSSMSSLNQLNSIRDIKELLLKLPYNLRGPFRKRVHSLMQENKLVNFSTFVKYVNEQSSLLNIPLLGDISDRKVKDNNTTKKKSTKTLVTNETKTSSMTCPCCKKTNHNLDECFFFARKPMQDREEIVKKHKLCFGCLKTGDHRSSECTNRLTCRKCKKSHPTPLHRDNNMVINKSNSAENPKKTSTQDEEKVSLLTKKAGQIYCPAIPVILKNKKNDKQINTYAALDNFSTASYMDEKLMKKLGFIGEDAELKITTIEDQRLSVKTKIIRDIEISDLDKNVTVPITQVYAKNSWPFYKEDSPRAEDVKNIKPLSNTPFRFIDSSIGLLIGMDHPQLLKPLEIVESTKHGPYASKHLLGWALNGPVRGNNNVKMCFRTQIRETTELDSQLNKIFAADFEETQEKLGNSRDERQWIASVESTTKKLADGRFQIDLPVKENIEMPDNRQQAFCRMKSLTNKLSKDEELKSDYFQFMETMKEKSFIERVPENETDTSSTKTWFVTHHGVRHKQKGKLRVVFDCSMKYNGISLNDVLWKGPDLANSIVGTLIRFRMEKVAITADIEKMYFNIALPQDDRDYLRFYWFEDNFDSKIVQYRMCVHLFGATTSSSVANFALKKCADDTANQLAKQTIEKSFYVDDLMSSYPDEETATETINEIDCVLQRNGFNLTSYVSNDRSVLGKIPQKLAPHLDEIDICKDDLPFERALGVKWNPQEDCIGYNVTLHDQPNTKRGILSTIFSIYDPLFLASPALIKAKKIFQLACTLKLDWDEKLPTDLMHEWEQWKNKIPLLNDFKLPRCWKGDLAQNCKIQLHIFADGSEIAYGAVSYFRCQDVHGNVTTNIVMAKARLTPVNKSSLRTIPRIELNAARLAVNLYEQIREETACCATFDKIYFWTDSQTTLTYLQSQTGRFQKFVENRVAYILNTTDVASWRHVPGKQNPADLLSRGTNNVEMFIDDVMWAKGPTFLQENESCWPDNPVTSQVSSQDPELRKKQLNLSTKMEEGVVTPTEQLIASTTDMYKLKCRVATFLKYKRWLLNRHSLEKGIDVKDLKEAELAILGYSQQAELKETYNLLLKNKVLPKTNPLKKYNPFIDSENLIRVGGRLQHAPIPYDAKHPIILHGKSPIVALIIQQCHVDLGHLGVDSISAEVKQRFHIIKGNRTVRSIIRKCIICRKTQGRVLEQKMADLPPDRFEGDSPPFTNTATDCFGPFYVTRGRATQEKRYGIVFTCLVSRAVHLELTPGLDTSHYINALRRFISRRGTPKILRSDNGTNLTSSDKELKNSIKEWNTSQVDEFCKQKGTTWIFQPPHASHFGGIFERKIRTIRKIFNSLLREFHNKIRITDDLLNTLFCEIENIMNSIPITVVGSEPDMQAITPNHLLRLQARIEYPPGVFSKEDIYTTRRWRQAQYLADLFWQQWKKVYLPLLNTRSKWIDDKRCLQKNDIVLLVDDQAPRNDWRTGIVVDTKVDSQGKVHSAEVRVTRPDSKKPNILRQVNIRRPVQQLVLLLEA